MVAIVRVVLQNEGGEQRQQRGTRLDRRRRQEAPVRRHEHESRADHQWLDARASHQPMAVTVLWVRSLVDLVVTAPGAHIRREHHVPQPVAVPPNGVVSSAGRYGMERPRVLLGLMPLWILPILLITVPGFMDPMFASPPTVLGLPAGIWILVTAMILMSVGAPVIRRASPRVALLAFLLLTVPSLVLLVMGPAMILITQNLTT